MKILDRFRGCLMGLAVGDTVGTALEFKAKGNFTPDSGTGGQALSAATKCAAFS